MGFVPHNIAVALIGSVGYTYDLQTVIAILGGKRILGKTAVQARTSSGSVEAR